MSDLETSRGPDAPDPERLTVTINFRGAPLCVAERYPGQFPRNPENPNDITDEFRALLTRQFESGGF